MDAEGGLLCPQRLRYRIPIALDKTPHTKPLGCHSQPGLDLVASSADRCLSGNEEWEKSLP